MLRSTTQRDRILALVPAFQCANTIESVVNGIRDQGLSVLVVDDGSSDETAERARRSGAKVISHARNRGKGWALRTGFRWALSQGMERVLTLDADLQHDPDEIPRLLAFAGKAALVIGRRQLDRAHMPTARIAGNRISSFFIGLFCGGATMHDSQCGFRLYDRSLLMRVPLRGGRFETETELLMRASLLGLPIRWVPISTIYAPPEAMLTNFDSLWDTLRVIRLVLLESPRFRRS